MIVGFLRNHPKYYLMYYPFNIYPNLEMVRHLSMDSEPGSDSDSDTSDSDFSSDKPPDEPVSPNDEIVTSSNRRETEGSYTVLVPVANPEHVDELMRTAVDVAGYNDGQILVVSIILMPRQTIMSQEFFEKDVIDQKEDLVNTAVEMADDVPATGKVITSHDVSKGIVNTVREEDVDAVLMGWRGRPRRQDILVGSNIDRVANSVSCDILVEKVGRAVGDERRVRSILFPAARGSHNELASEVVESIALTNESDVTIIRVVSENSPDSELGEVNEILDETYGMFSRLDDEKIETRIVEGEDVIDTIVEESSDYDITVLGAAREGLLRQIVFGTIPEEVGRRTDNTVIMTRRIPETVSRSIYNWLLRRSL